MQYKFAQIEKSDVFCDKLAKFILQHMNTWNVTREGYKFYQILKLQPKTSPYIYRQKKEIVGGRPHHMQTKESSLGDKSSHDYYLLYGK